MTSEHSTGSVRIKRIYDTPSSDDGMRILIDRLWPRGVSKQRAAIDEWMQDIAPSTKLRTWFHHDQSRFEVFSELYKEELRHSSSVGRLRKLLSQGKAITLLYGAKDPEHNHALVVERLLTEGS